MQWRRGGGAADAPGRRKPVGAPTPCPAGGGAAQSRGQVGAAQRRDGAGVRNTEQTRRSGGLLWVY
jgi:hypothetical protein